MSMRNKPWTAKEAQLVQGMRDENKTLMEISQATGRSLKSVKGFLFRAKREGGCVSQSFSAEETEMFVSLIRLGHPVRDAFDLFPNRSLASIRKKYERMRRMVRAQADSTEDIRQQDEDFCSAVLLAIRRGLESPPIGIVKTPDTGEFRPARLRGAITQTYVGSPASLCVDFA